jgi:sporulation protein YlmC with PRC-barrel domain
MAIYSTLGDYRFPNTEDAAHDIRGSKVYGADDDEKLGEIDDVIFDQATGAITFAVIETGGWLTTRKFIVPPDHLQASAKHENGFRVDLTKAQIESFPAYDSAHLKSEESWAQYEGSYRSNWANGPVMHREGTDRNITPTTQQQLGAGSGTVGSASLASAQTDETADVTPIRTGAAMDVSPSGPSLNWTTFEDRLRQRKEEVLASSLRVAKQATSESDAARRKAS